MNAPDAADARLSVDARLLHGRVALVTGGGRGVGRGVANLLAAYGASVVVNDLGVSLAGGDPSSGPTDEVVGEIGEGGGAAIASYESIADFDAAGRVVQSALDAFGRIDILVNPAGILRDRMLFNMSKEEWDAVLTVHLKGHYNLLRHVSPLMKEQGWGRIIGFSSTSGLWGNSGQANYGAAKDGIAGLIRSAARDLAPYGVTCNAIAPSADTRMTQSVPDAARELRARSGIASAAMSTVAPRPRPPEAIAPVVVWLCTEEASSVNGQVLYVSGGLVGLMSHPSIGRAIAKPGPDRWTIEELAQVFPGTLGMDLPNPAPPQ